MKVWVISRIPAYDLPVIFRGGVRRITDGIRITFSVMCLQDEQIKRRGF